MKKNQPDAVQIARQHRHIHLLSKVKGGQALTKTELDELSSFEEMSKKTKKKTDTATLAEQQICRTQAEAADFAGVSKRTIRRWSTVGMLKTAEGYYIKSQLRFFQKHEGIAPSQDRQREQKAQADYKTTKASLLELELKIKEGRLIEAGQIEKQNVRKVQSLKRNLLGLGRKTAPRLAKIKDPRKIAAFIDGEIKEMIKGFAR